MNILFPKIKLSLGKKAVRKPKLSNPFTTKAVTLRVPALKAKGLRIPFGLRSPFVKR